jgi:hypothetical protein
MATKSLRGALLRSLPVLLLLLMLGLTAPQTTTQVLSSMGVVVEAPAESTADTAETTPRPTPVGPVADRTRALTAQHSAGVTGSRAPPLVRA